MALLERDWEIEYLNRLAARAVAGHGAIVFIGGETGSGKSALVRAFAAQLDSAATVLIGVCDSIPIPGQLGPLRDLAESASAALRESVANGTRDSVFRAALAELSAHAGATILVFEDVHWADDATLDLLRFLGRRAGSTRGLVIATYRDDDTPRLQRLRLVLGDLATVPDLHRFTLAPLSRDAVATLAKDHPIDLDSLVARTGGNPFFVIELLHHGDDSLPGSVEDAIRARYAHLSESARRVLAFAAILGQKAEIEILRALADHEESALAESVESGALQLAGHSVRFRHDLVRDAVLAALSPMQRMRCFGAVFDFFTAKQIVTDPATMAHLAEEAGRFAAVPAYARAAADRAAIYRSYREAATQYQRALRYSSNLSLSERGELLGRLAEVTFYCGSGETDPGILRELVRYYQATAQQRPLARHLLWLSWVLIDDGLFTEATTCVDEALQIAHDLDDPLLQASALSTQATLTGKTQGPDEALRIASIALDYALAAGDPRVLVQIRASIGAAQLSTDPVAGENTLDACIATARANRFDIEAIDAQCSLGFHWVDTFRLERAERILTDAAGYAATHDLDCWRRWADLGLSRHAFARGNWIRATDLAGSVIHVRTGCFLNRFLGFLTIARVRVRRGDPDAGEALDAARASCPEAPYPYLACSLAVVVAEAALLSGDRETAIREATAMLPVAIRLGFAWIAGELAYMLVAAGASLPGTFDPIGPYRHAIAGNWPEAARAWRQLGAPYETARAQVMTGDEPSVRQALTTFDRLGAQPMCAVAAHRLRALGVSSIPRGPRPSTKAHPYGLTAREAEVLEQMGQGWTNSEIAARLFLSQRTVEHHVSSLLPKLGVRSRREAIRLARQEPITPVRPAPLFME